MSQSYGNFIDGSWQAGKAALQNVNPSDTRDLIGLYASASEDEMRQAVAAARNAFPRWASTTTQFRSDLLLKVGTELIAHKEALGELVAREAGKTRVEAMGEVVRAGKFLFFLLVRQYACALRTFLLLGQK